MTEESALGVAVAQFAPSADKTANLASIQSLTSLAVSRGARLVVFPEYSSHFTNPLGRETLAAAEPLDGPFVQQLGVVASQFGIHLVAGIAETGSDDSRFFNTIVALDPSGNIVATYRKLHLYDAFGFCESDWVKPGQIEAPETFVVGDITVGMQTCYDLRFPEVTRRLVDARADLVLVPADWVPGPLKEQHWSTLLAARAIENTVYVAAADHPPPNGIGLSLIVDPMGITLASIGAETDVAVAFISAARLAEVRRINPALVLRRFMVSPG